MLIMTWLLLYIVISLAFGWYNELYHDINRNTRGHNWIKLSIFYILICWFVIPVYAVVRLRRWFFRGY